MRHKKAFKKLTRTPAHRRALFRNLATSLVLHEQIETTLPKAKELKRVAEKLITIGKKNSLHARRQAMGYLFAMNREVPANAAKLTAVHKLFTELAPRYASRNGGYTRVVRTRKRDGDKAQMAVIEFIKEEVQAKAQPKRRRRTAKEEKSATKTPASAETDA